MDLSNNLSLNDTWSLYYHLPFDQSWNYESYINVCKINTIPECVSSLKLLTEQFITNCMFFYMRSHIKPMWEDNNNIDGGCFSLKIPNKFVYKTWNDLIYKISGETLFEDENIMQNVNGITISPKKYFCIIKIWMKTCEYSDTKLLANINYESCIFKKHKD